MKKIALTLMVLCVSCTTTKYSVPLKAALAPRALPTEERAEALGFYSRGCLKGAQTFKGDERGLELSQVKRGRYWAHPQLIDLLIEVGEFVSRRHQKKVIVGDLSLSRGGPTLGGHTSHQNGLDVDLWFSLGPKVGRSFHQRETEEMESILKNQRPPFLSPIQQQVLDLLSQDQRVQRIFVHHKLKKELCEKSALRPEQLRKIRPWYGHDDHLHVRLYCPESDKNCEDQNEPPVGSGCDQLSWWESEEARQAELEMDFSLKGQLKKYKKTWEDLPLACQKIYEDVML